MLMIHVYLTLISPSQKMNLQTGKNLSIYIFIIRINQFNKATSRL
jgi:hypothetical protein